MHRWQYIGDSPSFYQLNNVFYTSGIENEIAEQNARRLTSDLGNTSGNTGKLTSSHLGYKGEGYFYNIAAQTLGDTFLNGGEVWLWYVYKETADILLESHVTYSSSAVTLWRLSITENGNLRIARLNKAAVSLNFLELNRVYAIRFGITSLGEPFIYLNGVLLELDLSHWDTPDFTGITYLTVGLNTTAGVLGRPLVFNTIKTLEEFNYWWKFDIFPTGDLLSGMLFDGTQYPPISTALGPCLGMNELNLGQIIPALSY